MAGYAVVAGLGNTGQSVIRHLVARGWRVSACDTRQLPPELAKLRREFPDVNIVTGKLDATLLEGARMVVASPGLSQQDAFFVAARAQGSEVIGDIELFARSADAPVAGITGTNGKSTVTTLLARMANRAGRATRAGGNLAPPALELLENGGAALYVLELSSYQLETTFSLSPAVATVLNVSADHLDRYADLDAYAAAKARIFERCGTAVINLDDPLVRAMVRPGVKVLSFSLEQTSGADYRLVRTDGGEWLYRGEEPLVALTDLKVFGHHNAANALAALAMGEALDLDRASMLSALREFPGLPHRAALVGEIAGVRYVNDSKGTNVGATLAAVAGFTGPLLLIAGGDGKNQDFSPLAAAFAGKVRRVFTIGRDAGQIEAALAGVCPTERCATLELAVLAAARAARPGDTVLLSPACASLDMFRDYAQRGDVFAAAVRQLAA